MTETEKQILIALQALDDTARRLATGRPKPDLQSLFTRIDELAGQLPPGTDPTLMHYLHKKSYAKARLFLEGRDAENQVGACRHV